MRAGLKAEPEGAVAVTRLLTRWPLFRMRRTGISEPLQADGILAEWIAHSKSILHPGLLVALIHSVMQITRDPRSFQRRCLIITAMLIGFTSTTSHSGVLPDDRADVMYHSYNGGGVDVTGPSVLVLKKLGESVAVTGNYYVDSVSSASIDVVTTASKYSEDRTELSAGVDYLHGNSIMSLSYTNSDEDDYKGNTASFGVSIDMFSNMTTVSLGYAYSWDTVENNNDPGFSKDVTRQNYRVGLTQVITRDMLMELTFETITDEGFLNNPYRSVRYVDSTNPIGYSFQPEVYPHTRTSNALAVRTLYYLPFRASVFGEYRFFDDTWDVRAHNIEVGYTQPVWGRWMFEGTYRYYTQDRADFYSDLFPRMDAQNFMGRDKELSDFHNHTVGLGLSYEFIQDGWRFIDKGSVNLLWQHIWYDYNDFRDIRDTSAPVGKEELYNFDADVVTASVSIWF